MTRLFIITILILFANTSFAQSKYIYQTDNYICHNRNVYGNWANEQIGHSKITIVFDLNNSYITFIGTDAKFTYYINSSYKRNVSSYTHLVYECVERGVPYTIVLNTNNINGDQSLTLENIQTRVTYHVTYFGAY